jgi:hypothetical protein
VQVLELARFYHAAPNTAERVLPRGARKPKQRTRVTSFKPVTH